MLCSSTPMCARPRDSRPHGYPPLAATGGAGQRRPQRETVTTLEWLLLPLIHFLLLGYLPILGLRYTRIASLGARCGQLLLVRHDAYEVCGGYAGIRSTIYDDLTLPTLLRHGFRTDMADVAGLAICRMRRSSRATWNGLMKNATEGLAAIAGGTPSRTVPSEQRTQRALPGPGR